MPSKRDANSVDPMEEQKPRPTEPRAPSEHPGSKEGDVASKDTNHHEKYNEKKAHAGAAEGPLRSLLGKLAGFSGVQKTEKQSPTHDKAETPKDRVAEGPAAEEQVSHDAPGSKPKGKGKVSSKIGKKDERREEKPETKTPTEKDSGKPSAKTGRKGRDEQPVGDQQSAETSPDAPRKRHAREGPSKEGSAIAELRVDETPRVPDEDRPQAGSASHEFERDPEKSRKPGQRRDVRDRLQDVTSMLKGDTESMNSHDDSGKKDRGVDPEQSSIPTVLEKGEHTKVHGRASGRGKKNRNAEGTQREYKATRNATHSNINDSAARSIRTDTQDPSLEPVEAICAKCGDWIHVDPKTGQICDPEPPIKPEICDICGQPWPDGKPFSEAMIIKIKKRLEESRYKKVLCERCAAQQRADEQVETRGLDDNGRLRDGHFCKETDFERDEENAEPENFPDDPDRPSGNKKALLIGINYSAQEKELKGCRNDVKNMYFYLKSNGYKDEDIDILMDVKPYNPPTMKNIVNHMKKLVEGAKAGESLFFHYSGHGGQTEDKGKTDELDGKDECIYPVDYRRTHPWTTLIDDNMHDILTDIPKGVHLTAIFDSCHSGSVLDLPYVFTRGPGVQKVDPRKPKKAKDKEVGRVILWSGCDDRQTSADTKIDGISVGAMSHAFITANWELLQEKRGRMKSSNPAVDYTYEELLVKIERILREKFSQKPQLSSNQLLEPKVHKVYI